MTYDFELYFTGLCLFTFQYAAKKDNPDSSTVLLVNATRHHPDFQELPMTEAPHLHHPHLVASPRHLRTGAGIRQPEKTSISHTGEDAAVFDIELEDLEVSIPGADELVVPKGRKTDLKVYESPSESGGDPEWFDWTISVPSVAKVNGYQVDGLRDECSGPLTRTGPVISRIKLSGGTLESFEIAQKKGVYGVHVFKSISGKSSLETPHCITDRLVLRGEDLPDDKDVIIATPAGEVKLGPSGLVAGKETVRAAVVNLPEHFHHPRSAMYDFLWFYTLYKWSTKPAAKDLPVPRALPYAGMSPFTPSTGTCPPGGG